MMKYLLFTFLVFTTACSSQENNAFKIITYDDLKNVILNEDIQIIDVRTESEYLSGYINNAVNIDVKNEVAFKEKVSSLDKSRPVYLYCKAGGRSKKASKMLGKMGFTKIYNYSAGFSEWVLKE